MHVSMLDAQFMTTICMYVCVCVCICICMYVCLMRSS